MVPFRFSSITEQVAAHLGSELRRGRWQGTMPGRNQLVEELGVSPRTVELAFELLEKEGLLVAQGTGRPRRIVPPAAGTQAPGLRVALLLFSPLDARQDYWIEPRHLLEQMGHHAFFPGKTMLDLDMHVRRVIRFVRQVKADAWVVGAGSREVLAWFAQQERPAFAMFGLRYGLPIAGTGPDKAPAFATMSRRLIALGHRRISFLCRREFRLPQPGRCARALLDELESAGIATGTFNLPDWKDSREGFERILDSLFASTPPTVLILDEPFLYNAAHHYVSRRGLRVPEDVSLVCTEGSSDFDYCQPTVSHIRWDHRPLARRILRWVNNIARGKSDRRQSDIKAEFVEGGTIGPAPKQ